MVKVFVMIFDWLKRAVISNFWKDHTLKLEWFVFKFFIDSISLINNNYIMCKTGVTLGLKICGAISYLGRDLPGLLKMVVPSLNR